MKVQVAEYIHLGIRSLPSPWLDWSKWSILARFVEVKSDHELQYKIDATAMSFFKRLKLCVAAAIHSLIRVIKSI